MPENAPGVIRLDEIYSLGEFQRRSGLKSWAIRTARRNGLRIIKTGNRLYVRGADFNAFIQQQDAANHTNSSGD